MTSKPEFITNFVLWKSVLTAVTVLIATSALTSSAQAPTRPPIRRPNTTARTSTASASPATAKTVTLMDDSPNSLNFSETPVDQVLTDYAMRTKRILLINPNVPKPAITLTSPPGSNLSEEEYLAAVEQILNLNGIALKPIGEKFLRVLPSSELVRNAPETLYTTTQGDGVKKFKEDGEFVSAMIELRYIDITEAKTVIDGFIRQGAQIQTFERTNSIIVNDSADNVNRIVEILGYMDKPIIAREEPRVVHIKYAKASDVKARLQEIISESQEESTSKKKTAAVENRSGTPGTSSRQLPPGVTLPRSSSSRNTAPAAKTETYESLVADAARGIIRGKVTIIADERTNLLIIITRPENMVFFEDVIKVLDVPTDPDVYVEVFRLEHAVAADVESMINSLIGNGSSKKDERSDRSATGDSSDGESGDRGKSLSEFAKSRAEAARSSMSADTKSSVGKLDKDNIKILADERTNSLIIMASKSDMFALRQLISGVDIMLSQVVIETVIVAVTSSDSLETGVDWVQRAMSAGTSQDGKSPSIVYASAGGGGNGTVVNPMNMTTTESLSGFGSGATFLATIFDLNMDLIIKAAATDSKAQVVSSPRIMTLDNKEAVIESTERIYWNEGTTYYSGSDYTSENIKSEDIGIKLTVTPRINNKGYITLTIEQEIQANDGYRTLNSKQYPNLSTRRMGADVAVQSGDTIVLGGLAQNSKSVARSKIPILGSIPILGRLFRYDSETESRTDIVMFLTPKVTDTPAQIEDDSRKIRSTFDTDGVWRSDWSMSELADPISSQEEKKMLKRAQKTVKPPRHPLSGHLAPLNEIYSLGDNDIPVKLTTETETPATDESENTDSIENDATESKDETVQTTSVQETSSTSDEADFGPKVTILMSSENPAEKPSDIAPDATTLTPTNSSASVESAL